MRGPSLAVGALRTPTPGRWHSERPKKEIGVRRIARDLGIGVGTVLRLTAEA
jgi:hypothetical protein